MIIEWTRKNNFVQEIRRFLKRFRIVEIETETSGEYHEIETATGGKRFGPTGRDIVTIRLKGFWRDK